MTPNNDKNIKTTKGKPVTAPAVRKTVSKPAGGKYTSVEPPSMDTARLHTQLHELSRRKGDEMKTRAVFRQIIMEHTGAIGVGHVLTDEAGQWELNSEYTTGRLPSRPDFVEKFARCCSTTIQRNSIQIEQFLGLESVYAPIRVSGSRPEVLLVLAEESSSARTLFVLETAAAYFSLWLQESQTDRNGWKLTSLAALVELVSQIEKQETSDSACQVVASELARHLKCDQVAAGFIKKGNLQVAALSGNGNVNQNSDAWQAVETALNESLLRDETGVWPPADGDSEHLLLAHQQLAHEFQSEAVLSCPLKTVDGDTVGAMLLSGSTELIHGDRLPNFVLASSPRIASALDVVKRGESSRLKRLVSRLQHQTTTVKGRIWYGLVAVLCGLMLVPVPYRVRCNCTTETTQRRYAVAPFDGLVKRGYVEPGDLVDKGQLLAEMDGQSVRFELAGVVAELNQARKKREIELAARNIPASLLADLESQRLVARKSQLEFQQEQIEIRSPFKGIVLSGSLERIEGASVQTGKVLFEIAPLNSLKVEIAIPAEEVACVEVGQSARIWVEGLESQSFPGAINRIHPRSERRDGRNVFVAEVTVPNPGEQLRPGMQGHARIDCSATPLAWNLFHKPWNYVMSRVTWW